MFIGGVIFIFALSMLSFESYKFFAPKYTEVDRRVFEESRVFNEGMVRDLENIKIQYDNADEAQKESLRAVAIHRFEVYPLDKLPPNLQRFYNQLESQQ